MQRLKKYSGSSTTAGTDVYDSGGLSKQIFEGEIENHLIDSIN
jgi:hypothetical protein